MCWATDAKINSESALLIQLMDKSGSSFDMLMSKRENLSRALEDIAFRGFGSPDALQTINALVWDESIQINELNDSTRTTESIIYLRERTHAINVITASIVLFVLVQILGVIPFNILNIIVIRSKRELWTQTNALMCINSAFQLVSTDHFWDVFSTV